MAKTKSSAKFKKMTSKKSESFWTRLIAWKKAFWLANWKGTLVILVATLIFFWPMVTRIGNYSEGGDAMFNAWTLARNHHCILGDRCDDYTDSNIYFPHEDTMLYSETQLSTGLLTLPLHLLNKNPIFAYNVWTITSFFLMGWFMYLLAKFLSKGKEVVSIVAGLVFAFAPFQMAAIFHLQNISIFYLPLSVLLVLKYFKTPQRKYLAMLFIALVLQFYASWVQMVFVLTVLGILLLAAGLLRLMRWRPVLAVGIIVSLATLTTLPLAKEYMRFSKSNEAGFSLKDQLLYSSSVADYFVPHNGTALGKLFYKINPDSPVINAYNLDSYSYHGVALYALAGSVIAVAIRMRKKSAVLKSRFKYVMAFAAVGLVGFIFSLGPLLKLKGNYAYAEIMPGIKPVIVMPYMLIDKFLPQLQFIRAVGRWSVLFLFALCCLLAYGARYYYENKWFTKRRITMGAIVLTILAFEVAPLHQVHMAKGQYAYNLEIPAVYRFVKDHSEIDHMLILAGDHDYTDTPIPVLRAEWVLWAGYHNREIFNGYSGYTPPKYMDEYIDFKDFNEKDVKRLKELDLRYVIVDKQLSTTEPELPGKVDSLLKEKLYEDSRYSLYKTP
jgi:hypothetical protein